MATPIVRFFGALRTNNLVAFVPDPVWRAYQAGLLKFVGAGIGKQRLKPMGFDPAAWRSGSLISPTFTDKATWEGCLAELGLRHKPVDPWCTWPIETIAYDGEVFDLTNLSIVYHPTKIDLNIVKGSEPPAVLRLKREFGLEIWAPSIPGYPNSMQTFCGEVVLCKRKYAQDEVIKTRRRIQDHVAKNGADAIRVAKFLKLK